MARFTHLLSQFAKNKDHERRTRLLDSSRKEVNINANGTSGYTVKEGVNKGRVLGHNSTKSTNNR